MNPRGQFDISDCRLEFGDEAVLLLPPDVRLRHEGSPQVDPPQLREGSDCVEEVQAPELASGHAQVGELGEELGEVEAVVDVLADAKGCLKGQIRISTLFGFNLNHGLNPVGPSFPGCIACHSASGRRGGWGPVAAGPPRCPGGARMKGRGRR